MTRVRVYVKRLFWIVLGVMLMCILLEICLQLTDSTNYDRFAADALSGLVHYKPNTSFVQSSSCFSNIVHTNSFGFHAPEPPLATKKPGEFRIVLVGNSFVEGMSVPTDETISSLLEQKLNTLPNRAYTYEVIPVAFSGNGTYFDILYYLRYGRPLSPDLVIDITTEYELGRDTPAVPNPPRFDMSGNLTITPLPAPSQDSLNAKIKNLMRQSKLVMNVYNRYLVLKQEPQASTDGSEEVATTSATQSTQEWTLEEKLLQQFTKITSKDKATFMIASWDTPSAASSTAEQLHTHLTQAAATNHFQYFDLTPVVSAQTHTSGISASWPCDEHWSDVGNEYVANALATYLQNSPTLITR